MKIEAGYEVEITVVGYSATLPNTHSTVNYCSAWICLLVMAGQSGNSTYWHQLTSG